MQPHPFCSMESNNPPGSYTEPMELHTSLDMHAYFREMWFVDCSYMYMYLMIQLSCMLSPPHLPPSLPPSPPPSTPSPSCVQRGLISPPWPRSNPSHPSPHTANTNFHPFMKRNSRLYLSKGDVAFYLETTALWLLVVGTAVTHYTMGYVRY